MEFDREVFDLMPSGSKTFNLIGLKMPSDKDSCCKFGQTR